MIVQLKTKNDGIYKIDLTNYILWRGGIEFLHVHTAQYFKLFVDGTGVRDYKYYNYNWVVINDVAYRVNEDDTPESYLNRILIIAHNIEIDEALNNL